MPIYDYRCTNGHRFEVLQRIADDPLTECEVCGAPAVRVLHPVAIHFKGSGFYSTDYGRAKKAASAERAESAGESKSKDGDSKSSEPKKTPDSGSSSSPSEPKKAAEG